MPKKNSELMDLKSLIAFADTQAEKIFYRTGQLLPMYHAFKPDGEQMIIPAPQGDKDISVGLVKAFFALHRITLYVFMDEAWILDTRGGGPEPDMPKIMREGLRNHPDRREVLMYLAENREGQRLTANRFILRPEHGKPKLSPLRIDDMTGVQSEGRMIGLLS